VKNQLLANRRIYLLLGLFVGIAITWKLALINLGAFPFNADEAIVALMGRHILQGEIPIFFYGQAYMGSLDAFLVALSFLIFSEQVNAIRYVQILLYVGVLLSTFWLSVIIFRSRMAGLYSVILLAIPTVNVTLYTTVSLGGYGEALLIGNLLLCFGLMVVQKRSQQTSFTMNLIFVLFWGALAGLGLWANGLTLVYSLPMGFYLAFWIIQEYKAKKRIILIGMLITGGLIGAAPWISFAVHNSIAQLLQELLGSAVAVESGSWFNQVVMHTLNFVLFGIPVILGFRPPWEVSWLVLPLIPFVGLFWFLVIKNSFRKIRAGNGNERWMQLLPAVVILLIITLFIFTHFGVDPSGRYFLPINIMLAIYAGIYIDQGISKKIIKTAGLILIISFQFLGTIQCLQRIPPGLTTQFDTSTVINREYDAELIAFLKESNETRGFTNYWVSYPLAFLSREELIFTPRLPYHQDLRYTPRDDRYATYTKLVEQSEKTALITSRNIKLNLKIREFLQEKGISWREKQIGDYLVFYSLSNRINSDDLNALIQP
jgi:4-amino-4-deoxy-L-arabinose transferase-like glycosyltransferase